MSRSRLVLQPHARLLRRGDGALQIGLVDSGVVVTGLEEHEIDQLLRLRPAPDSDDDAAATEQPEQAEPPGVPAAALLDSTRVADVVTLLGERRLLVTRPTPTDRLRSLTPRRIWGFRPDAAARTGAYAADDDGYRLLLARSARRVVIDGHGRLAAEIARCLRAGGIGRIDVGPDAAGAAELALRRREERSRRRARRGAARPVVPGSQGSGGTVGTGGTGGRGGSPGSPSSPGSSGSASTPGTPGTPGAPGTSAADVDLVVLLGHGAVDHRRAEPWRRRDVPHIPVVVDGPVLRVGPLVDGPAPCLLCLDLHRTDRDPQWPRVLAQLDDGRSPMARAAVDAESALRSIAAGLTAMFVHARLDGQPWPAGLTVTYRLPSPEAVHHVWHPHPRCRGCADRVTMAS